MKKRMMSLFFLAVVVVAVAPTAIAECVRCTFPSPSRCITATGTLRFEFCFDDGMGNCYADTQCTTALAAAALPLATEYSVASVERIDGPDSRPDETLVAMVQTPAPANR